MKTIKTTLKIYTFLVESTWMLLLSLAVLACGCDNFTEADPPHSQLSGTVVFEDIKTADAAMAGIYISMRDGGLLSGSFSGMTYKLGLYADELDNYAPGINYFHSNSLFADNSDILDSWTKSYSQLYAVNAVLEGVAASVNLKPQEKDRLRGEALFLRALLHSCLSNLYGAVPYVQTTDYNVNSRIDKISPAAMAEHITADLNEAVLLLPEEYTVAERIRPNRFAAYALLARVALYGGRWAEAAEAASAVINSPQYSLAPVSAVFLKESPETIWQFQPDGQGSNTREAQLFIFTSGPPPQTALGASLMDAFEPSDQRKPQWTKAVTEGTAVWYHSFKYRERAGTGTSKEYSIMLRLAEQYLIRAEARAQQGDIIGAGQDLNAIRNRSDLGNTPAATPDEMIQAVLQERRVELFTELGHRFFDLKRNNALDAVLQAAKPGWNTYDALWPIPAQELRANPKLNPQNTGY